MEIREQVTLAQYTTFHVGGPARYFAEVKNVDEIKAAMRFADEKELPVFILGGGSNLIISDSGFNGLVIALESKELEWEDQGSKVRAIAGAGVVWDEFVSACVERGLWGAENLSGIPGSIGAAVVQNIGAYGVEVASVIEWVEVFDTKEKISKQLSNEDCGFGYRDSVFKHHPSGELIITRAAFLLSKTGSPDLRYKDLIESDKERPIRSLGDVRNAVLAIRGRKFPEIKRIGTAGSFFKNPVVSKESAATFLAMFPEAPHFPQLDGKVKLSAAWIIDHVLHMKGVREGNVGTWSEQALVLINYGGATAAEIARFAKKITGRAKEETDIELEREVIYVGDIEEV